MYLYHRTATARAQQVRHACNRCVTPHCRLSSTRRPHHPATTGPQPRHTSSRDYDRSSPFVEIIISTASAMSICVSGLLSVKPAGRGNYAARDRYSGHPRSDGCSVRDFHPPVPGTDQLDAGRSYRVGPVSTFLIQRVGEPPLLDASTEDESVGAARPLILDSDGKDSIYGIVTVVAVRGTTKRVFASRKAGRLVIDKASDGRFSYDSFSGLCSRVRGVQNPGPPV